MVESNVSCKNAKRLSLPEIEHALKLLPGWSLREEKLHRELSFNDFSEAFSFMTRAAMLSERMNHHPDWFNVYNKVVIDLTTHDAGGISEIDIAWAKDVERILKDGSRA